MLSLSLIFMTNRTPKKYNYLYETILVGSDKKYYGMHSSDKHPDNDPYLGSGKWVKSIKDKNLLRRTILSYYDTIEELMIAETELIAEHLHKPYCMNFSPISGGGNGLSGENHPNFAKDFSTSTRKKMSDSHIGNTPSEKTKQKLSNCKVGSNNPMYGKFGEEHPLYGYKHTQQTKKNMSASQKGKTLSEEAKKHLSVVMAGRIFTDEHKKNLSVSLCGEKAPHAKLNEQQVREIKVLLRDGFTGVYIYIYQKNIMFIRLLLMI
jgi:hypothetical protein